MDGGTLRGAEPTSSPPYDYDPHEKVLFSPRNTEVVVAAESSTTTPAVEPVGDESATVNSVAVAQVAVEPTAAESTIAAVASVAVEPVAVEPVAVESAAIEPVAVESVAVESAAIESAAIESAAIESAAVEPVAVEPSSIESAAIESVAVEPVAVEPVAVEPSSIEPVAVESAAVESAAVESAAVESAAVESAAVESAAVEAAAEEPVAVEPAVDEPVAVEPAAFEPAAVEPVEVDPVAVVPGTVEPSLAKSLSEDPVAEWIATDEFLLDESTAMEFNALESDTVEPARAELDNLESSVDDPGDFEPVAGVTSEELETLEDASEPDWLEMLEQPSTSSPGTHRITVRSVPDRPSSLTIALPQEPDLASCSAESPETSGDTSPDYTARDSSNLSISGNLSEIETSTAIAIPNERESSNAFEMPNALETSNDLGTIANSEAAPNPKPADPIGSPSSTDAPVVQSWNDVVQPVAVGGVAALPFEPTSGLRVPPPRVLSLRIPRPTVKVSGFTFPEAPWAAAWLTPTNASSNKAGAAPDGAPSADSAAAVENGTAAAAETAAEKPGKLTRIKPPGDVIKLEDRLYYVLQPPLESLMACGEIHMPFEPFPYQYEGIGFLYPRYTAVLADEMGLGKTMQAIMTIRLLLRAGEIRNVLLVCPKPLVSNWRREFQTWAPEIPVGIIEGDQARRHWQWRQASTPVKIANYELLMRDRDVLDANLHFDLVALDEAQRIKNKSSTTSEIVRSIARTRSWALTGTPVENSPEDIVGIFEFLSPGYLSNDMQPRRMGELVKDHILRRTKDMVLTDMPPKLFRDATLDLSPEQYETYRRAEDDGVMKLTEMGPGITIQHVFELVLRLKQICNFDPVTGASSKLERLEADLEEVVASGQKAILFTQWVVTIARLREKLARFGTLEYHGQLPHKQRETVIDQFKNDPSKRLIMMSYGAGSVGLNLQFCRYVFLFDRWWNPAIEDQAINRAHRIGVSGPVTVTRMITGGTIEERINQVLDEKRELFNSILSHADNSARGGLTQNEIFGLFNLKVQPKPKAA